MSLKTDLVEEIIFPIVKLIRMTTVSYERGDLAMLVFSILVWVLFVVAVGALIYLKFRSRK